MRSTSTFKKLVKNYLFGCLVIFQLASCKTVKPPSRLEYFQSKDSIYPAYVNTVQPQIAKIQRGDILGIIIGSLNKESNEILNFYNVSALPVSSFTPGAAGASSQPLGYPVDSLGNVYVPLIGKQKLEGLTLQLAEDKIRLAVEKTIKDPAVNIRFMNHKFTVLGEVGHVGTFNLLNDKTTIVEAITAAGDLTIFGKRDSITVIRSVGEKREIGKVSLRDRSAFNSPYFYVRNDDIIYIEPTKEKAPIQTQQAAGLFVQRAPLYLSLITTLFSLVYLVRNLR